MGYVPLHVHTDGSTLDGAVGIKRYIERASELRMRALGISDHGNMINALYFQQECEKSNIKPVFGCEFYMGAVDSHDKFHILLIAKNNKGLENLYKLNAYAYTKNFYSKPRITWNELICHKEGLILTTACLGSEFGELFKENNIGNLINLLIGCQNSFGSDFYIELQSNTIPMQRDYNLKMLRIATEYNIPVIVTTDAHYVKQEDATTHDTMLCMQTLKKKNDAERFRFSTNDFYIQSEQDIREKLHYIDPMILESALHMTEQIANRCSAHIETNRNMLPKLPGLTEDANIVLAKHCNAGYVKRYGKTNLPDKIDRIKYEMSVIREKGYSDYFLIVQDFIEWCKSRGIYVGDGRGSACGSEVAYILGITNVEPMQYGLLFERFLNPERMSAPDID